MHSICISYDGKYLKPFTFLGRPPKSTLKVLVDLPAKSEVILYTGLSTVQKKYYQAFASQMACSQVTFHMLLLTTACLSAIYFQLLYPSCQVTDPLDTAFPRSQLLLEFTQCLTNHLRQQQPISYFRGTSNLQNTVHTYS